MLAVFMVHSGVVESVLAISSADRLVLFHNSLICLANGLRCGSDRSSFSRAFFSCSSARTTAR